MPNKQPTGDLRGVLLPEPAILEATYNATSQAGPRSGPVTPSQTTGLTLHSTGELDSASTAASGTQITISTLRGGNVGSATLRWGYTGEDARSYDPPVMLSGWEYVDRTGVASRYLRPHVVRRASTGLLACSVIYDSTTVQVWRQSVYGKWTSATVEAVGSATDACLIDLPSGRLVCLYSVPGTSTTQIRSAYSDDDGATWSVGSTSCLASPYTATASQTQRIRAVYLNGQICLVVWVQAAADVIYQYVSTDNGSQFSLVETFSSSARGAPDLCVSRGAIFCGYLAYDAAGTPVTVRPYVRRITSASQALTTAQAISAGATSGNEAFGVYGGGVFTSAQLALTASDEGVLYLFGSNFGTGGTREIVTRVSNDQGETWDHNWRNSHGTSYGTAIYWSGDSATCWRGFSVAPERGRLVMAHTFNATIPDDNTSLCMAYLGGWSSVGMPDPAGVDRWECSGWDVSYVPIDKPGDIGGGTWSRTTSGIGTITETLAQAGLTISTDGTARQYYTATPSITGYETDGILAEWQLKQTSGTTSHILQISDGTRAFSAELRVTTTQVELRDYLANSSIATLTIDATKGIVIRLALDNASSSWALNTGRARAWARIDGPYTGGAINHGPRADRLWSHVGTSSNLQSQASSAVRVRWGQVDAIGDATYRWVTYSAGQEVADNIADQQYGDQRGHTVLGSLTPMHLASGYRIHASDGSTVKGDSYTTSASYEYPITAINPSSSPSPRRRWRSTTETQQDITISGLDLGARSGDVWGLYLAGCNWRTATLYRDTTATTKLIDIDLAKGLTNLNFSRSRDLVYPRVGGSGTGIYFGEGGLVGATMLLSSGQARKIKANTTGAWLSAAANSYAGTRVQLESYQAGDTASGAAEIWMPSGLVLFDNMQSVSGMMLRIGAQTTADGYFSIGAMVLGRVRWFGQQYSRGRSISFTPAYELTETQSGARRVRALGPTRRAIEIAWDDGIDTTGLFSAPTATDFWTLGYTGADPIASKPDTALTLGGVIQTTQGATLPTVLISAVKQQNASPGTAGVHILHPDQTLYGRILTESLRIDSDANAMGNEFADPGEVVKIGSVRFEQEV